MVDSSIGGKVGIDHPRAKNLIGAFHQPRAVLADLDFLDTLPPRQRRSGGHEMLKCGVIGDPELFAALEGGLPRDRATLAAAVAAACRLKARVVEADEREGDLRRVLNLGHTLGHALESETGYRRFTHGEAVGWGTVAAVRLALHRGLLPAATARRIEAAVDALGPRPGLGGLEADGLVAALARDKKVKAGRLVFVLPAAIGRVEVHEDVQTAEVWAVLAELLPA
jgi:3-dehydroquinate synthase